MKSLLMEDKSGYRPAEYLLMNQQDSQDGSFIEKIPKWLMNTIRKRKLETKKKPRKVRYFFLLPMGVFRRGSQ